MGTRLTSVAEPNNFWAVSGFSYVPEFGSGFNSTQLNLYSFSSSKASIRAVKSQNYKFKNNTVMTLVEFSIILTATTFCN